MPSNIFATTGTSVSIIFIDKTKEDENVLLMDASSLGTKIKLEEGQRTVLSSDEEYKIVSYFKQRKEEVEFSALVSNEDIKENAYSVQAGQYIELKEEELDFDIDERLSSLKSKIIEITNQSLLLDKKINSILLEEE